MLPDDVLLEIFDFYKDDLTNRSTFTWHWETLSQVCRRWRHVVFGSPRRLNLRVVCTNTTRTRRLRDIWPTFPIIVFLPPASPAVPLKGMENIIAALGHRDRISEIRISDIEASLFGKLVTAMLEPLPVLTHLSLRSGGELVPELPETFLGGSAPRLQSFLLSGVPFPSFPKFISRFTHIAYLHLFDIPNSWCLLPDALATCLTLCPSLKSLSIGFRSPLSRPLQIRPPPLIREALRALTSLSICGVSEYFEDFVSRIDTPVLNQLIVSFFMDLIFDIPRLCNFIDRTALLGPFSQAVIMFSGRAVKIVFGPSTRFELEIRCERRDWQLSSMTQIFAHQLPLLSHVEQLEIRDDLWGTVERKDDPGMDPSQWLELLCPFVAVQNLRVSKGLIPPIANALQQLTGRMALEVLPALGNLSLEGINWQPSGPVQHSLMSFVTARQLSDHPVVIQRSELRRPYFAKN